MTNRGAEAKARVHQELPQLNSKLPNIFQIELKYTPITDVSPEAIKSAAKDVMYATHSNNSLTINKVSNQKLFLALQSDQPLIIGMAASILEARKPFGGEVELTRALSKSGNFSDTFVLNALAAYGRKATCAIPALTHLIENLQNPVDADKALQTLVCIGGQKAFEAIAYCAVYARSEISETALNKILLSLESINFADSIVPALLKGAANFQTAEQKKAFHNVVADLGWSIENESWQSWYQTREAIFLQAQNLNTGDFIKIKTPTELHYSGHFNYIKRSGQDCLISLSRTKDGKDHFTVVLREGSNISLLA